MAYSIRKRVSLLSFLSGISALAYIPFIQASLSDELFDRSIWLYFPLANILVVGLASLVSIPLADKLKIPMPQLRSFEGIEAEPSTPIKSLAATILWSVPFSIIILQISTQIGLPENPGSLFVKLLTTPFAAINLQVVVLLLLVTLVYYVIRSRLFAALLGGVALSAIHLVSADVSDSTIFYQAIFNGGMGAIFAWIYLRHGFEFAVLGHALAHIIIMLS